MAKAIDNLRERWERITPREQKLVMALGATAVFIVLALIGFDINDRLTALEDKNQRTRKALSILRDTLSSNVSRDSKASKVEIPDTPTELESYLEDIGKEVGVTIPGYSPRPKATRGIYTEVSTRIQVRNIDILQLTSLLEQIESKSKVVVVTDMHIKRHFREQDKLDAELVVSTYYREPKKADGEGGSGTASEG